MDRYQKMFFEYAAIAAVTRTFVMAVTALVGIACLSVFALAAKHTAPAISIGLILATYLIILPPILALKHDYKPDPLRGRILSTSVIGFGLLAAVLSYANYVLYFLRAQLSPAYVDTALPMHRQAITVVLLTLVLCIFVQLLVERAHNHSRVMTFHLLSNNRLLGAFGISLFVFSIIAYSPLQSLFDTQGLSLLDWLSAIACSGLFLLFRVSQRHTRKHSRKAVIALHHQVRGSKH